MKRFVVGSSALGLRSEACTVVAADTQLSYGSMSMYRGTKIFSLNDTFVAFSGEHSDAQEVMNFIRTEEEKEEFPLVTTSYFKMLQRLFYSKRSRLQPLNAECIVAGRGFLGCVNGLGNFFESDVICTGMAAHIATPYLRASSEEPVLRMMRAMELLSKRDCRASNEIQIGIIDDKGMRIEEKKLAINWDLGNNNNEIVYGLMRKLQAKEEKIRKEEELKEEEAKRFWAIGAKDESKQQALELKRQEKIARRAMRKKIYDEEHGL
ncbi:UNVERIFIED_CONTAM: hypothetical protein PYX00_011861 [Menopon gallinae]|uniref:Proteasome subunit beta type-4 n=1 Tax=Menopon gallinae TaxID=328185 RepID=A0AAW2H8U2_9NEOP